MDAFESRELAAISISKISTSTAASLKHFDCGDKFLNEFAKKKLIKNDKRDLHKGFVGVTGGRVVDAY